MKHDIDLQTARQMVDKYRLEKENVLSENYREKNILPNCETFDIEAIQRILKQAACKHLRIYFGMNEENQVRLILVGVDEKGKDLLPHSKENADYQQQEEEPPIVEEGSLCPPNCPPESDLYP